ncbi:MAG: hypothetical protein RJA44_1029, partial [Pseudomonadota bacterium]
MPLFSAFRLTLPRFLRCLLWLCCLCGSWPALATPQPLLIDRADFTLIDSGVPAQQIRLPDTWAQRDLPVRGHGRYVLRFQLTELPLEPWVLQFDRLAPRHLIRINGHFLASEASSSSKPPLRPPQPSWMQVPPEFLQLGTNVIDIEASYSALAGLSAARFGPAQLLLPGFRRETLLIYTLPLILNVGGAALALFMVLIWWRRPTEEVLGGFGAFWAIASIRNVSYYITELPLPVVVADWLYFASQVIGTVLLGRFAMTVSGRQPRSYSLLLMT